jgi:hypothetical protein
MRRAPSLARQILEGILVDPALAREVRLPAHAGLPDLGALAAVVECCQASSVEPIAAAIVQTFSGTAHEAAVIDAQASALDHALSPEVARELVRAGVARLWQLAGRAGTCEADVPPTDPPTPEESERLRQLDLVRAALHAAVPGSKPDEGAPTLQML